MYFEGKGKVYAAPVTNGVPGAFRWVADCNQLQLQGQIQTEEIHESYTGLNLLADRIQKQPAMNLQMTLREWVMDNIAWGFWGTSSSISSGSVTGEALPANLAQGDLARLKYTQVSAVQITDSAATPATLVAGTDYTINAAYGSIEFIGALTGYTQPFAVDYSYNGGSNAAMFTALSPIRWLRLEGLNIADSNSAVLIELYKVQTDPLSQADFIGTSAADLQMKGAALYDPTKQGDTSLGQFGRIIYPAAA